MIKDMSLLVFFLSYAGNVTSTPLQYEVDVDLDSEWHIASFSVKATDRVCKFTKFREEAREMFTQGEVYDIKSLLSKTGGMMPGGSNLDVDTLRNELRSEGFDLIMEERPESGALPKDSVHTPISGICYPRAAEYNTFSSYSRNRREANRQNCHLTRKIYDFSDVPTEISVLMPRGLPIKYDVKQARGRCPDAILRVGELFEKKALGFRVKCVVLR